MKKIDSFIDLLGICFDIIVLVKEVVGDIMVN